MNRTSGERNLARNFLIPATALGLWAALVLLFAAPLALRGPISWNEAVRFGVSFWALWLFFLPAVAWLAFRFPIERRKLFRNVGIHILACLIIVGGNRIAFRFFPRFSLSQGSETPAPSRGAKTDPSEPEGKARYVAPGPPPLADSHHYRVGPPGAFGVFIGFRAALDVLVYWSLLGLCQAITNFRSSQERERRAAELEARLTSSKLHALRMQLNPHFLFNTLNAIATLVYINPRAADEMLNDLSELLRRSLESMDEQEIPLAQELEFIEGYLNIEQKRFGERLQIQQSVPDELRKALVPALILQPLVENAIRHGIEPRRGPGLISIEARQEDKHLHLIIRDNGRGLLGGDLTTAKRRGVGLANTQERLRGLYGSDQGFSLGKAEPQGCQVHIRLPFHLQPMAVPAVASKPTL